MARLPRCATCGKAIRAPLRGGRIYCSLECRPTYREPASSGSGKSPAAALRAEIVASGRPLATLSFIELLSLRRVATAEGGSPSVRDLNKEIARRVSDG